MFNPNPQDEDDMTEHKKITSASPGMLVAYIYNEFPGFYPFTLQYTVPLDCRKIPCRHSWLEELKADVKRGEAQR